jgi:hypothetical protein
MMFLAAVCSSKRLEFNAPHLDPAARRAHARWPVPRSEDKFGAFHVDDECSKSGDVLNEIINDRVQNDSNGLARNGNHRGPWQML